MPFIISFLLLSFITHLVTLIPFINFLYRVKLQRQNQKTKDAFDVPTPIFDAFHGKKTGTPIGGGILVIVVTTLLFFISFPLLYYFWVPIHSVYANSVGEVKVLLFTFLSFGTIGLYDDIRKVFFAKNQKFYGLRLRHKLLLQIFLSLIAGYFLYSELHIHIINIPFLGVWDVGILYILFAAFVILSFANAFNISDGLDGLSCGILMIALTAFWVISHSILDTPLSVFIAVWLGGVVAFLYFNVFPARIFLGDVGALSFGATFAVIGLLLGKPFSLLVVGGFYVVEILTSLLQLLSKKYRRKKLFEVAPLHLLWQKKGWNESTIVFRAWIFSVVLAVLGLWFAIMK